MSIVRLEANKLDRRHTLHAHTRALQLKYLYLYTVQLDLSTSTEVTSQSLTE